MNGFNSKIVVALCLGLMTSLGCRATDSPDETAAGSINYTRFLGGSSKVPLTPENQTLGGMIALNVPSIAERSARELVLSTLYAVTKDTADEESDTDFAEDIYIVRRGATWWYFPKGTLPIPQVSSQKLRPGDAVYTGAMNQVLAWKGRNEGPGIRAGVLGNIQEFDIEPSGSIFETLEGNRSILDSFVKSFDSADRLLTGTDRDSSLDTMVVIRNFEGQTHNLVLPSKALLKNNGLSSTTSLKATQAAEFATNDVYLITNLELLLGQF